jgi:pilus assembly protein CpaE
MTDSNLDVLLAQAQRAYLQRDKHSGAQLIDEILQRDFNYPGAWHLLYRLYGAGKTLEDFRRSFANQYYPDKINLLTDIPAATASDEAILASSSKPDPLIKRIFDRLFRRSKKETGFAPPTPSQGQAAKPASTPSSSGPDGASAPAEEQRKSRLSILGKRPRPEPTGQPNAPSAAPPQALPRAALQEVQGRKIHVVVVDDIAQTRENLIRSLHFQTNIDVIGTATNGQQAIQLVKEMQPDVVLMDVNMPDMDGITATQNIRQQVPSAQVVIITVQDDVDYIRRAMNAGARDFLTKPPVIDEMIAAIEQAAEIAWQEKSKLPSVPPPTQPPPAAHDHGRIITVYSPRGGVGCTLLATNLAGALHNEETPVVVVDGNLQFGDVPIFFNVQSKLSLIELASRADELDPELVDSVLIEHVSGIKLLGPPRPEEAESVKGSQFSQLLTYLRELYAYVIVDTAHQLNEVTLASFDVSDLLLLLTSQDIPSIARVRKFLDLAPQLHIEPEHVLTIMNQYNKRINITPEKVKQSFNLDIAAAIPLDKDTITSSINRGAPFVLAQDARSHPVSQAILDVVNQINARIIELERADGTTA